MERTFGVETEYGIFAPDQETEEASRQVVEAAEAFFLARGGKTTRWEHTSLNPDKQRLYEREKALAPLQGVVQQPIPSADVVRLSAQEEKFQRRYNKAVSNGSRFYVDHSHPEYSTPECDSPYLVAAADFAGTKITQACAELASELAPGPIQTFKNNQDGKGHAYGTHENYLMDRSFDPEVYADALIPFCLARVLVTGSGRVGLGQNGEEAGFQISQRADFVEQRVSLTTTVNRGVINTRDEPHCLPQNWRRFHYIGGDANNFPYMTWLKTAITGMVLELVQAAEWQQHFAGSTIVDPALAARLISRDLTGQSRVALVGDKTASALEILRSYTQALRSRKWNVEEILALDEFELILDDFSRVYSGETNLDCLADRVEWVAKYQLLNGYVQGKKLGWDDDKIKFLDLQWSNTDPKRGLALLLIKAGRVKDLQSLWEQIPAVKPYLASGVQDFAGLVDYFIAHPPVGTRAWGRGEMIRCYDVPSANWHCLVVDAQEEYPQLLFLSSPFQWTKQSLADSIEELGDGRAFLDRFAIRPRGTDGPRYGNLSY